MPATEERSRLASLLLIFLRLANLTFGGGSATVAALQHELVEKRNWLSLQQFGMSYALSRITPGTNLYAFCTAAAWLMTDTRGAVTVLLIASLPCCILIALLTAGFDYWSTNIWVKHAIDGALAASVGLLLAAFWSIVRPFLTAHSWIRSSAIVAMSLVLSMYFNITPIAVFALAGLVGWFLPEDITQ